MSFIHLNIKSSWAGYSDVKFHLAPLAQQPRALLSEVEAHPWSTLGPNIGSDESLGKIRQWISSCQASHKSCGSIHGHHGSPGLEIGTFFPTRVIDVEEAEAGVIFLRERAEVTVQFGTDNEARLPTSTESSTMHKYPVYWTLSHRWGDADEMPRLLKDTESQLRKGVRLDKLPPINGMWPTFRDAALLVKRLGYRYIWIDSLCIFQDSDSEWQREASTMIDIYRHSYCNISAGFASYNPANNGLFRRRELCERHLYPAVVNIDAQLWWAWCIPNWNDQVETVPLNKRGWVVQERFLATRTIHFAGNQVFWECLEDINYESKPTSESLADLERNAENCTTMKDRKAVLMFHKLKETTTEPYPPPHDEERSKEIYESWTRIVEYYASCGLTKESDRLIAVSGMAKAFQEATGDTYMAGLWKGAFGRYLTWYSTAYNGGQVRRSEYAPTWSWASTTGGGVEFFDWVEGHYTSFFKLIGERIVPEPPNGDSFGLLLSAELDMECMICYLRLDTGWRRYDQGKTWVYHDEARSRCFFEGHSNTDIYYDLIDSQDKFEQANEVGDDFVCTFIPVWKQGNDTTLCLILERDVNNRYKRAGLLKWYQYNDEAKSPWDNWTRTKSLITLI
ncbi:HET-domain-containing protein [Daldinia vernicosa]|uniref:HET-domain-containing protein n=1 Tax=Daldinia vernicosa TaxID=114800 RepID=UPI002008C2DB|nr:HET-domain-containing protein [Daldinia vernicosa]KAI0845135.1 HET-domain-containing protein [Daldinia vernicosa]